MRSFEETPEVKAFLIDVMKLCEKYGVCIEAGSCYDEELIYVDKVNAFAERKDFLDGISAIYENMVIFSGGDDDKEYVVKRSYLEKP